MLPDVLSAALRALGFVAVLQAGGAALFLALCGGELAAAHGGILRLIRVSACAGAVLLCAQYLLEPARMAGTLSGMFDAELQGYALHTRPAMAAAMRLAGVALVAWALRANGAAMSRHGLAGAVLIALSFTVAGHSAGNPAHWWLRPLLGLHLLVVEFWFGALLPLLLAGAREPAEVAARAIDRFSKLATSLVPLIFVSGLLIAVQLLPDPGALREPYGIGLVLKAVLFSLLMALAALNKWRLGPALARGGRAAQLALRRSIATEFVLIVLVLMGTATLTTFWSPES